MIEAMDRPVVIKQDAFRPIMNYKKYVEMLRLQNEHPPEMIRKLERIHEEYYAQVVEMPPPPGLPKTGLTILHTESEVNDQQPFINFNKVKPRASLAMYEAAGIPDDSQRYLENRVTVWEQSHESKNATLDLVLSKYSGKTQARKKKKSLRSRFLVKSRAVIKDEDVCSDKEEEEEAVAPCTDGGA